jgi:(R,R)-butanediol dehydrogenase/meso-butanediol dehydrogenase/diacetyl reductase
MKSARLHGPGEIRVDTVEEPPLRDGWVRVNIEYTGICGSDVHEYESGPVPIRAEEKDHRIPREEWDEYLPKNLGHETVGTVFELGDDVEDVSVGDRVTLSLMFPCEECRYCAEGKYQLCERMSGSTVGSPGFSESMTIPAENAVAVPDGVSFRHAALVEPLSVSLHSVNRVGISLGDTVAVFGAGSIGLGILAMARAAGARRVFVSEPLDARRNAALELGADMVVDPTDTDPRDQFREVTDGGVDVTFEAAGLETTLSDAMRTAKYDGTVAVVGVFDEEALIHPNDVVQAERNIIGSFGYSGGHDADWSDFRTTLALIDDGRIDPEPLVTDVIDLGDIVDGFERLAAADCDQIKVLVEP